jgi:hypothetical protein
VSVYLGTSESAAAVTPSDSTAFSRPTKYLYVGGTGNLTVIDGAGNSVLFQSVPAGAVLPIACTKVMSTGTAATKIVAMF